MTRFYLLRHGETLWNHQGNRYCGITDISLNSTGQGQAHMAGRALLGTNISSIYCSPLQRSQETAGIIGTLLSLEPIVDDRLYEINFGKWEGLTRSEIENNYANDWASWLTDPCSTRAGQTGDTGAEVLNRYESFVSEQSTRHEERSVLIIGHNTANRLFISGAMGLPLRKYRSFLQNNCGISVLEFQGGEYVWVCLNETAHLREPASSGETTHSE